MPPISVGHGPGPVHVAGLYAQLPPQLPTGNVPPQVTNAAAPQLADYGSPAFGFAAVFATALLSSSAPLAPEQSYGLHAAHTQEYAVTRAVFPAVVTPPPASAAPQVFISIPPQGDPSQIAAVIVAPQPNPQQPLIQSSTGTPQSVDLTLQGFVTAPLPAAPKFLISPISAAPQGVDLTIQGFVLGAAPQPQGQVPAPLNARLQQVDLTLQSTISGPQLSPQAKVPALVSAPPQTDPSQPAALITPPAKPAPSPLTAFLSAAPQVVDLTLQAAVFAPPPLAVRPVIGQIAAAPQSIDLTIQGFITGAAPQRQGRAPPQISVAPQPVDLTQQASLARPPPTQPTVAPSPIGQWTAAPQNDPSQPPPVITGPALASSIASQAGRYRHGTHAQATYEYAITRAIYTILTTPQGRVPPLVAAPPQADPTQPAALFVKSASSLPAVIRPVSGAPQSDPTQAAASIFAPAPAAQRPLLGPIAASPQSVDLTIQGWIKGPTPTLPLVVVTQLSGAPQTDPTQPQGVLSAPLAAPQGKVPPPVLGRPQDDPTQIQAQLWPSLRTPPVIPNPITAFFVTTPQFEERPTAIIWPSVRVGQRPPVISQVSAAPQVDLTLQGWVVGPQRAAPQPLITPLAGGPQLADLTQQGAVWMSPARQGAVPPLVLIGPQTDPSQPAPVFTPSTRSPPVTSGKLGVFVVTLPQFEERVTDQVFPSQRAGRLPPVIAQLSGGPQQVDLTLQGFITKPLPAPPVAGKMIFQWGAGMPQQSTELNASVLWTTCTFTPPSAPPSTCMWGSTWKPTFT
jgi:hypothetical protein